MTPCKFGSECDDVKCIYGHRCPNDVEGISLVSIAFLGLSLLIIGTNALICGLECRKEGLSLGRELPLREGVARARQGRCQDSESRKVDQGCDRRWVWVMNTCALESHIGYQRPYSLRFEHSIFSLSMSGHGSAQTISMCVSHICQAKKSCPSVTLFFHYVRRIEIARKPV